MLDVLITGGEVYDGTGAAPVRADVGIAGDRVARIGPPGAAAPGKAAFIINAAGKAVAPGFINILSHSYLSILLRVGLEALRFAGLEPVVYPSAEDGGSMRHYLAGDDPAAGT
jgi:N-acyl-D-amino-acid deacylase